MVAIDLSPHPEVTFAVVFRGQLLPIRFAKEEEAMRHLVGMETGRVVGDPAANGSAPLGRSEATA